MSVAVRSDMRGGVVALGRQLDARLEPLVPRDRPFALVGFPNHSNVGDSAIWLGELAWLRRRRRRPAYVCDGDSYAPETLAARVGDGTILIHGGGNLGDIWPEHQELRERVISDFPANRVVQLPQSIHFRHSAALERARAVFDAHPDLTLLVRDETSLELARREFAAPSTLAPDMAFGLGPVPRAARPAVPILWLARTDAEAAGGRVVLDEPGVELADWLRSAEPQTLENLGWGRTRRLSRDLGRRLAARRPGWRALERPLALLYDHLAARRLRYGRRLLGRGRVVVTDRLHGHILSALLGIPHVVLDTGYGKIRAFHDAWTSGWGDVRFAESPEEALAMAREEWPA